MAMDNSSSDKSMIYLHGDMELSIIEARSLPNMDLITGQITRCISLESCRRAPSPADRKLGHHRKIITSDPYVTVSVPQATVARTRVIPNSQTPIWDEHFHIPLAHPAVTLEFQVKDNDVFGAEVIGSVHIPAETVATGELISGWFPIISSSGKPPKPNSALKIQLKFTPCHKNPLYKHGIAGDPDHLGVRHTYFPLRKGCQVQLYQDAHITDDINFPKIELDGGRDFHQGHCWEDICYAISEAHHMIYLVGWSIYHKVKLVREPTRPLPRGGDLTLGELLKYKSEEGVRILILIWDDKTSHKKLFINTVRILSKNELTV